MKLIERCGALMSDAQLLQHAYAMNGQRLTTHPILLHRHSFAVAATDGDAVRMSAAKLNS